MKPGCLDALQIEILGTLHRQRLEHGAFGVHASSVASVVAHGDIVTDVSSGSEAGQAEATGRIPPGEDHLLCYFIEGYAASVSVTAVVDRTRCGRRWRC